MRSTSFQRLSQAAAVLFLTAFTLVASVGAGSLRAVEDRPDDVPAVLVQTDDQAEDQAETEPDDAGPAETGPPSVDPSDEAPEESAPVVADPNALVPIAGSPLTVVGVESDDVLNFRTGPDPKAGIVVTRPASQRSSIVATGEMAETAAGGIWWEVTVDGESGWANARFLSVAGSAQDITADLVETLPTLRYDSPQEAVLAVVEIVASADSRVTVVNQPANDGEGGVVVVDVVGVDDADVDGYRLHIELLPVTAGGSDEVGAWVKAVESTPLCRLGIGDDGLCA